MLVFFKGTSARAIWTHIRVRTGDDVVLETRTSRGTIDLNALGGTPREFPFKNMFLFVKTCVICVHTNLPGEDELGGYNECEMKGSM